MDEESMIWQLRQYDFGFDRLKKGEKYMKIPENSLIITKENEVFQTSLKGLKIPFAYLYFFTERPDDTFDTTVLGLTGYLDDNHNVHENTPWNGLRKGVSEIFESPNAIITESGRIYTAIGNKEKEANPTLDNLISELKEKDIEEYPLYERTDSGIYLFQ